MTNQPINFWLLSNVLDFSIYHQLVNWLIYYREKLHGKTLEDLRAEREEELKNVVDTEVAELPSEKMYQKLRLD